MEFDPDRGAKVAGSGTGVAVSVAPEDPASSALTSALQGLQRAFQKLAMYPSGHPSVPEAIEHATRRFDQALTGRQWVVIRITRNELIWEDERISDASETLRSLASLLHDLDLAAVEFRAGLQGRDLETLVHLLAEARRDSVTGAPLVESMEQNVGESIRLCAIDYRVLNIAEGVQQGGAGSSMTWEHLSQVLTDPDALRGGVPVQELANEVEARLAALEGTGVTRLRSELHRQMQESSSKSDEQSQALRRRMGKFVAALNPDLRRNLLQVGASRPRESLSLMNDLADSIPPREILEALQNVDRAGGEAHGELVGLLRKLVRISLDRPAVKNQLEDTLSRWGVSTTALHDMGQLGQAVEEVLHRRSDRDFNPTEYKGLLGDLTSGELSGSIPESAAIYGDPNNVEAMRAHCVEIAVRLLGRHDGDDFRPALFGYVGTHADCLLERGEFAPVVHAVVAARADRALKQSDENISRAAQGFLEDFQEENRVELILEAVPDDRPLCLETRGLLALGGPVALDAALNRLDRDPDPEFAGSLRQFCAERSPQAWSAVLEQRLEAGWSRLETVFPVLRLMQASSATPLLLKLFAHESSRVRREALILLCETDVDSCGRHISRALGDESLRVVHTALRRLSGLQEPEAVSVLGRYAAGKLPGSWFSPESFNLALTLLLTRGELGLEALCGALDSVRPSVRPLAARRGRRIAELLASHRDDSLRVRESLSRWRRSPAALIARVLPSLDGQQGAREE